MLNVVQEEDVDDDTLTTDTLSPETIDSSHSSDAQVSVFQPLFKQLMSTTFPRIPFHSPNLCICVCLGAGSPAGGAAAQRGAEKPRPNHRTTHPAAGLCLSTLSLSF